MLASVLVPMVAVLVVGGLDARRRLSEADAASAVEHQVDAVDRALNRYLNLVAEKSASQTVVMAARFGVSAASASGLLGIDMPAQLVVARSALGDVGDVGDDTVQALRAAVDDGSADPHDVDVVFGRLIDDAQRSWLAEIETLGDVTYGSNGSGRVRQAASAMLAAAEAFAFGSNQTASGARLLIPALSEAVTAAQDLSVATSLYEEAAAHLDGELMAGAAAVWQDRIVDDPHVRAYERFVADALAGDVVAPPDIADLAGIFGAGLIRQEHLQQLVEATSSDTVLLAHELRSVAQRDLRRELWALGGLLLLSVAITAVTVRSIVQPLRRLAHRATEVSSGRIDGAPLAVQGPREVAVVTDAFNESVETLRAAAEQAAALATADFDHPSLQAPVPGLIGESLRHSVERLSRSMRDNEELRSDLARKATHDALTGLPNRVLLLDRLEQALVRSQRARRSVAVVFIDLDHFKVVNDAKGHTVGDALLVDVGNRIRAAVRAGDTVARFGGDEFVIVLEGIDGPHDAVEVCSTIRASLELPFTIEGGDVVVSASQGIAVAQPGDSAEDLLRTADAAMYLAKERGRARSVVADDRTRSRATHRLQIEADMRRGLEQREFVVHLQPIVALHDGSIAGAEALVRWQTPDRGLVMPDQFIPIAEETGLIVPLGEHVLSEALQAAARWPAPEHDGLAPYVAVNVSGRQFAVPGFADTVVRAVDAAGIDPRRVHLELTESVLMSDVERSTAALDTLTAFGVHVSIDDFGTGYSSLQYVQRLPIGTLKIDRSFVDLLERDGRESTIVTAVIDLGRALGVRVVAEGVETAKQLGELQRLGCRYAQGYYLYRPVPVAELAAILARHPVVGGSGVDLDRRRRELRVVEPEVGAVTAE